MTEGGEVQSFTGRIKGRIVCNFGATLRELECVSHYPGMKLPASDVTPSGLGALKGCKQLGRDWTLP